MDNLSVSKENWSATKGRLKQKFAILSDDDLLFTSTNQQELLRRLEIKLGKTKEEVQEIITECKSMINRQNKIRKIN
jgi:uncharacterized protein YjbJ (UPF0337 family)